jgi:dolichol-phosphate mannosyltransferase
VQSYQFRPWKTEVIKIPKAKKFELQVIVPCYNEAKNIAELCLRVSIVLRHEIDSFQFILVDDGSQDSTWEKICELFADDKYEIVGLQLKNNYGQDQAILEGIKFSQSRFVMVMDADLQHPPEMILEFYRKRKLASCIVGRQVKRQDKFLKRFASNCFYRSVKAISGLEILANVSNFFLIDAISRDRIIKEHNSGDILRVLIPKLNFTREIIEYSPNPRLYGKSKYNFGRMFDLAKDSLFMATTRLSNLSWVLFGVSAITGFIVALYSLYLRFVSASAPGWTSMIVILCFFSAGNFLVLAVITTYLGRIERTIKDINLFRENRVMNILAAGIRD